MTTDRMGHMSAELLILIADCSGPSDDDVCWVPPGGSAISWSATLGRGLFISGIGVANRLRALQRRGLIRFTGLTPYASRITEDGRLMVEGWRETSSWPVKVAV